MKPLPILGRGAALALMICALSCRDEMAPPEKSAGSSPEPGTLAETQDDPSPLDMWWDALAQLCGHAYAGELTSADTADADLVGQAMAMHVRRCEGRRLEIPFHIGENRSRTWILTRSEEGLRLQHDHRHEDGSEDVVTLYGGFSDGAGSVTGSASGGADAKVLTQIFPADDFSKHLFETNGLAASVANVWSMEIFPGRRFSYVLRRPSRHFQVDFDLAHTIAPPPAPWGHE